MWEFVSLVEERKVILHIRGKDVIDDLRAALKVKN